MPRNSVSLALTAGSVALIAGLFALNAGPVNLPYGATALLAAIGVFVEARSVRASSRVSVSATFLPVLLAIVVAGAVAGCAVAAISILAHFRRPFLRWFVWTCSHTCCAAVAGFVAWQIYGHAQSDHSFSTLLVVAVAAGFTDTTLGLLLAAATVWMRRGP